MRCAVVSREVLGVSADSCSRADPNKLLNSNCVMQPRSHELPAVGNRILTHIGQEQCRVRFAQGKLRQRFTSVRGVLAEIPEFVRPWAGWARQLRRIHLAPIPLSGYSDGTETRAVLPLELLAMDSADTLEHF